MGERKFTDSNLLNRIQTRMRLLLFDYDRLKNQRPGSVDERIREIVAEINAIDNKFVKATYLDMYRKFRQKLTEKDLGDVMTLTKYLDAVKTNPRGETLNARINAEFADFKTGLDHIIYIIPIGRKLSITMRQGRTEQEFVLPFSASDREERGKRLKNSYDLELPKFRGKELVLVAEYAFGYHFPKIVQNGEETIKL